MRSPIPFALALLWLAGPGAALAQATTPAPADPSVAEPVNSAPEVAPDSPRASLSRFLDSARRGRWPEASGYLELPPNMPPEQANDAARRLQAVLDRRVRIDFEALSPLPGGNSTDGLPPGVDEVARIPVADDGTEPVRMIRRDTPAGPRWLFTRATLDNLGEWYGGLEDRWLRTILPEPLLEPGPSGLLWWQWIALPVFVFFLWLGGRGLGWIVRHVATRIVTRTAYTWDDRILERTREPTTLLCATVVGYLALPLLALSQSAEAVAHTVLKSSILIVVFWAIFRILDVIGEIAMTGAWAESHPTSRSLVPLLVRAGKIAVIPLAAVAALSELGYPVASLLAGLGIGGLALALAAQKTVENMFGSVSIGVDQPFRVGDFVKIEDFTGTVESIGLRSTRIRTLDRTLITLPNGKLADTRVESFTARDRIRLFVVFSIVYDASAAQIREVLAGIEARLRAHPRIFPDDMTVRLSGLTAAGMEVTVMAWFQTTTFSEFAVFRQDMLLQILDVVEGAGCSVFYPSSLVHIVGQTGR